MEPLTIFGVRQSTYVRSVRLVCEEKGLTYRHVEYPPHSEEMRRLQPFGRVPAMVHGDFHLFEAQAIARYLDRLAPEPVLIPTEVRAQAEMDQWMSIAADYGFDALIRNWYLRERGLLPTDEIATAAAKEQAAVLFGLADQRLMNADYLAGSALSLADLFLIPQIMTAATLDEGHEMIEKFDRLSSWYAHMSARPSVDTVSE